MFGLTERKENSLNRKSLFYENCLVIVSSFFTEMNSYDLLKLLVASYR